MSEQHLITAYKRGWYNHGQMLGQYLWDVPYESFDGDLSVPEEIARKLYAQSD